MSKRNRWNGTFKIRGAALAVIWLGVGAWVRGGELDPPPGAIQPTGRQIINQQYFLTSLPYVITEPGSYVLTSNLTGVAGQNGIEVQADDVTIDLNGFALIGVPGSQNGICVPGTTGGENLTIINGLIRDWESGVYAGLVTKCHVRYVRANGNGLWGIRVAAGAEISHCIASSNGADGISSGAATISFCTANSNGWCGIDTGGTVVGCTAIDNGGDGINVAGYSVVKDCCLMGNNRGLTTGGCCVFLGCVVTHSTGDGIVGGDRAAIIDCVSSINGGNGIEVDYGSTVRGCTTAHNTGDGILVTSDCRVTGNTCDDGNAAGIHATGNNNRVDGNSVTNNGRGIQVDATAADNLVIRNSARANTTDYDVAPANNQVGTIYNATGFITGADPWVNFAR